MDAEEHYLGIFIEDVLRAVAVVDIPVGDQDAREAVHLLGVVSGQGDVVEKAETHALARRGVMPGRPNQAEGGMVSPLQHRIDR